MKYMIFHVELRYIKPKIWRTIAVLPDAGATALHDAIQKSGQWGNYHMWDFSNAGGRLAVSHEDEFSDEETPLAETVTLGELFPRRNAKLCYSYDYGDGWKLDVVYKELREIPSRRAVFLLLDGQRAFPPEDCGGEPGYENCLAAVGERQNDDADTDWEEELGEWLGDWDPNRTPTFDKVDLK